MFHIHIAILAMPRFGVARLWGKSLKKNENHGALLVRNHSYQMGGESMKDNFQRQWQVIPFFEDDIYIYSPGAVAAGHTQIYIYIYRHYIDQMEDNHHSFTFRNLKMMVHGFHEFSSVSAGPMVYQ